MGERFFGGEWRRGWGGERALSPEGGTSFFGLGGGRSQLKFDEPLLVRLCGRE